MTFKVIQINVWKGTLLPALVPWLIAEAPDIITAQELSSGNENGCPDKTLDLYSHLRAQLRMNGAMAKDWSILGHPNDYFAKGVYAKGEIVKQEVIPLKIGDTISPEVRRRSYPSAPRSLLDCTVMFQGRLLHVLSVHGAWTESPVDTPEKIRQANIMVDHIRRLGDAPFIYGGDFNMTPETRTIQMLAAVAHNIVTAPPSTITRTTHPTIHKTASFKPQGVLCDHIFVSPHFTAIAVDAPVVPVSDHLPVRATLEWK